ncbi:balbiani ring protein 3-like isoform X1 [Limulus polyphemus]|uniref:Balbiani ring protein 3-like isoform X1 n=1 Tax=Limulus polyphemus TaxID=6850 RepID=A0ABM1BVN9_LIMPO|nr:balbiani ring protein 3-like isoform X1 [Limulus polyphemus]
MADVEKHIRCRCECTLKPSSCNRQQKFVKDDCRCICRDDSKMKRCSSKGKFWDSESCQCRCSMLSRRMCSTGFYYDLKRCKCVNDNEIKTSSWFRNLIRRIRMED